ncbi:MAG: DUF4093 domain-containing protein [Oscillospiraceae bacterium]|jgi:ribonuclease M5|nr:DUF4093 domain-containing protein [Oscillospiraceae bacterium]
MSEKVTITQAILVEGKYDKIKLSSLADALILTTNGFQIYKHPEERALLRRIAENRGLILLTDSDRAGFQLRGYIAGFIPKKHLYHAYIPDVFGKEKRKAAPSKEGKLGVEGVPPEILLQALQAALPQQAGDPLQSRRFATKQTLYRNGLLGKPNAAALRKSLLHKLNLPQRLSTNQLADILNAAVSQEDFQAALQAVRNESAE